jgi:hypothetical protein
MYFYLSEVNKAPLNASLYFYYNVEWLRVAAATCSHHQVKLKNHQKENWIA